jgi:hypothetical protein
MMRILPLLAGLILSITANLVRAEVNIPLDCRVSNLPPGRCGWCALETLGRHQHIKSLIGLTEKNARQARPEDLERVLIERDISYRIQARGCFDKDILEQTIRNNHGAVVGFRELSPGAGGHIVTLVDFGKTEVRVIDPNDSDHRVRTLSRERFLHWWDGFVIVLTDEYTPPITSIQSSAPSALQR